MPTDIDLEGIKAACRGFDGRFEFQPEHTEDRGLLNIADFVDFDDRLVYLAADRDDDEPYVIVDCIEPHVAEPLAVMLNAVPVLVARVEELERECAAGTVQNYSLTLGRAQVAEYERDDVTRDRDRLAAELAEAREEAEQWQASAQAVVNLFDPAGHQASPGTLRLTCEAAKDANRALRVDRASLEAERDAAIRERDAILAASQRSVARISPEDVEALRWGHAELTDSEFVTSRMSQRFITVLSRLIASSGGSK